MLDTWQEQLKYIPNGTGTLSKMPCRYPSNYPHNIHYGEGGTAIGELFKPYIDLIAGLGAISVGYCNQQINEAIKTQLNYGSLFSLPGRLEMLLAKRLTELVPDTEMWKFGLSGTDANVMAVRAARAHTGRTKIMTVGYNGCADIFECQGTRNAGIPADLKQYNTRAFYNNFESFEPLVTRDYACVLMEPMVFDYPNMGFLGWVRQLCTDTKTLLIFDEIVNGGRFEKFTSSAHFGIKPDLYTLGKGLANGLPLSAVGGSRRIMQVFERSDFFASGTFSTPLVSLTAGLETVEILSNSASELIEKGKSIQAAFNRLPWNDKTEAVGYPTRIDFRFPTKEHKFLFWQEMCRNNVLIGYTNFVMVDHTPKDIEHICNAIYKSYLVLQENWANPRSKLEGPMPEEALLRKN